MKSVVGLWDYLRKVTIPTALVRRGMDIYTLEKKIRTAAKTHICEFCLKKIDKGERYVYIRGVESSSRFLTDRRHLKCCFNFEALYNFDKLFSWAWKDWNCLCVTSGIAVHTCL